MKQYLDLLRDVMENGVDKGDRTGTGTRSVFGRQLRFNLADGFPLVTTKKVFTKGIIHELLWFLKGDTNIKYLVDNGVHIWDEWADADGELGPVYGSQWRSWTAYDETMNTLEHIDQIAELMCDLKFNPDSRRHIISAWNVAEVDHMRLPPCHCLFQFYVANEKLSCQLYQRSADLFLGVPFNIASYALLTHMIAHVLDYEVGEFIHTFGDAHIYRNHFTQVEEQLSRDTRPLPKLVIKRKVPNIDAFVFDDFEIVDYDPHPAIKGEVSV